MAADPPRYDIRLHDRVVNLKSRFAFATGDRVNVLIRPEDLRIWREQEGSAEERAALLPAAVEEVVYKGSTVDLMIRLALSLIHISLCIRDRRQIAQGAVRGG